MKNVKNNNIAFDQISIINKLFLANIIIINFLIKTIFAYNSITIYSLTNIDIYIKDKEYFNNIKEYYNEGNNIDGCYINTAKSKLTCYPYPSGKEINLIYNLKTLSYMFKDCYGLTSIDLNIDSSVNETDGMFENCASLKSINFVNFRTINVANMSRMFFNCSSLEMQDQLNSFNTYYVTDMSYMFTNCSSLINLNLQNFNTMNVIYMNNMFEQCTKLNSLTQSFVTSKVKNMESMFSNCKSIETLSISNFDFTSVENTESMFKDCYKLKTLTLPESSTPSLINMASMFQSCSLLSTINLKKFDTSNVKLMNDLFHDCTSLSALDIKNFNTENVIKMESMFQNCESLKTIDLSNFYTPSVRQIYNLFYGCTSVTNINIKNFDTFQVTNFANLFYNCHSLISIVGLTNFVTNMASDMSYMFYNCSKLNNIDVSGFNTERVIKMNSMFQGCSSLVTLDLEKFNNEQVINMENMFNGCLKLKNLKITKFNTPCVTNMNSMFANCESLTELDLTNFYTTNVINMNSMFYECISLTSINLIIYNTSNVIDMGFMFYNCLLLTSIDLSQFQTELVENVDSIFFNCKSLKSLSLDTFSTQNVKNMKSMFQGCSFLELLDLSNFDTKNVLYMDGLFYDCSSLIRLDLTNFYINIVKSMGYMFYGCKSLTSLKLPEYKNLKVTNTSYMFAGCSSLTSLDLTLFDSKNVISMDYMFSGCTYLKHLILNKLNTENVRTMDYIFSGCASLTSLNIIDLKTPNLKTIKGMFYGCSSLQTIDLSCLDTSSVINMAYMFYKATSLLSINFFNITYDSSYNIISKETKFNASLVENMRYMFAYCYKLETIDLSFLDTKNVLDMSFMFLENSNLTSIDISSFETPNVYTMESMFNKCINLTYINMKNIDDSNKNVLNILYRTPYNMVFCLNEANNNQNQIKNLIKTKHNCEAYHCGKDFDNYRKKLIVGNSTYVYDQTLLTENIECTDNCLRIQRFEYNYICYKGGCPEGAYHDENDIYNEYSCESILKKKEPCTIQKVFMGQDECTMEKLLILMNYEDTESNRVEFINNLISEINTNFTLAPTIVKNGYFATKVFNETFHFTALSYKTFVQNLTYIDVQDCDNFIKRETTINENDELILLQMEYINEDFKIPIIEYALFTLAGEQLNISICNTMKFIYYIPFEINKTDEYKYNPDSSYNNEICMQFTTENKTDIILYDRRKEFNDFNLSLCESNCKFMGYSDKRVECECPVTDQFNKYYNYSQSVKDNLIFRFHNNELQSFNFGVLKCFKMIFTDAGFYSNYPSITYIVIIALNIVGALVFCIKGYKTLYAQIKILSDYKFNNKNNNNTKKKFKTNNKNDNIATSGNNPPPKPKMNNKSFNPGKDLINDNNSSNSQKVGAPSSLIDSKNKLNGAYGLNLQNLDELDENFYVVKEMDTNMLLYAEAIKKDKRSCFDFYVSFIKTRHIIVSIFISDYNYIIIKISLLIFYFGICLGINTFFFTDEAIQKIYLAKGTYNIPVHLTNHVVSIIISTIISSIIKSLFSFITYTDTVIVNIKNEQGIDKDNKINRTLIKVTSKSTLFYIINFFIMFVFWIYVASFCAVFKNTQLYLIINAGITFGGINILPLIYYAIPAFLRKSALNKQNSQTLYKFSQIFELI